MWAAGRAYGCTRRAVIDKLAHTLVENRGTIIEEWTHRLHTEVPPYSARPLGELRRTVTQITDANFSAIARHDFSGLDAFIVLIGKIRSRLGFSVSDVQKAFELYRPVTFAILARTLAGPDLPPAFERVNVSLVYTTNKFSDYFQALSEQQIREYAQTLEKKVEAKASKGSGAKKSSSAVKSPRNSI